MVCARVVGQVSVESMSYHKSCFKCLQGGCSISPSNYAALEGRLYCKHHFAQLFKEKGNYSQLLVKMPSVKQPAPADTWSASHNSPIFPPFLQPQIERCVLFFWCGNATFFQGFRKSRGHWKMDEYKMRKILCIFSLYSGWRRLMMLLGLLAYSSLLWFKGAELEKTTEAKNRALYFFASSK